MVTVQTVSGALDDGLRRELVYNGDILVFKDVGPMKEFCAFTDGLVRGVFDARDPMRAQFELDREEYVSRVGELQKRCREHEAARRLFLAVLERIGVDLRRTCWDWLYLRVLPHGDSHASGRTGKLGFHRDTWSSNVYSQTNWWAPVYPIASGRSLAFYPDYWSRPLENTSAGWDLEEVRASRRAGESAVHVPEPAESVDTSSELRMVVEPGDLLCFSGAHLHASVPNSTGVARFSVEARTVDAGDAAAHRGASNVDGEAPRVALEWFRGVLDGAPLAEAAARW